jgi:hypothetical protein
MAKKDIPTPMDDSIKENPNGTMHVNAQRNAYALVELVAEVRDVFPETEYGFGDYNGRNVALSVTYSDPEPVLRELLTLLRSDYRVSEVMVYANGDTCLLINNSARSMDDRASWGIEGAYEILAEDALDTVLQISEDSESW